jgi:hypothetical protein
MIEDQEAIGEEEVGFDVNEDIDVGDLSDQEGGVLPAASRVIGTIKKASIKTNLLDNKLPESEGNMWTFKSLHLEIAIGPLGTDGEGMYAGKVLFTDLIVVYSIEGTKKSASLKNKKYNASWWEREARYPAKQFIKAIGGDVTHVKINDAFLIGLVDREIMFDIRKVKDTFRGEGEFRNELANWRLVETQEEE